MYFEAFDGTSYNLYRTDGTEAGTVALATDVGISAGIAFATAPPPGDFNDDGCSDILWQSTSGQVRISELNGTTIIGGTNLGPNPGTSWKAIDSGDFGGDGHSDILWQCSNGQVGIWELNGTSFGTSGVVGPNPGTSWQVKGTGDFNGDGRSDILFQHTGGAVGIWELDGITIIGGLGTLIGANPGTSWQVTGIGDFDGDGKSDILWQCTNGQVGIWQLHGTSIVSTGTVGPNPGTTWKVKGTGDFNGDGKSDILFQHTSGQVGIWELDGTSVIGGLGTLVGPNPGPSWQVKATGDFNGDGKSDLLFQHTNGAVGIWEMDGTAVTGGLGTLVAGADAGWLVV